MKFRCLRVFIISLSLLGYVQVDAQWTLSNGPYGGNVNAFTSIGSNIFSGTKGSGVYLSTDNGSSWIAMNSGLKNLYVTSFAVIGNTLFAGTFGDGVYLSTDNGTSWIPTGLGLPQTFVLSLASNGNNLFAGTFQGVFFSNDNGTSWVARNSDLINPNVRALAFSGGNLFAGNDAGLFVSSNDGTSWTAVSTGLGVATVSALSSSGNNLFAASYNGKVARSEDNGATWTVLSHDFILSITSIVVDGNNVFAGTPGGGAWFSYDSGDTWATSVPNGSLENFGVLSLAIFGSKVFKGTSGGGIYISSNNGLSWSASNNGLLNANVLSFAVLNGNQFAGTGGAGVFISTNAGSTWYAANAGLPENYISSFASIGNDLFAGGFGQGVWHSNNNGTSWEWINNFLTNQTVSSFAVIGTNLFAGTLGGGVFRASHTGTTWTGSNTGWSEMNTGLSNLNVTSFAVSGSSLFVGTNGGGVFLSIDNGASWTQKNYGLSNIFINSLAVNGDNVFVATNGGGVFISNDKGTSWTSVSSGLNPNVTSLEFIGNNLFVGTYSGIFFSNNNGATWSSAGLDNIYVNTILIDKGKIFAGTTTGLYYESLPNFPVINSIDPPDAMVGTTVTISGTNFSSMISDDTVKFNGAKALITNATTTSLTVVVPNDATTGPVKVSVGSRSVVSSTDFIVDMIAAPIAIAASDVSKTGFKAIWRVVSNATGYYLDISTDNFKTFITNYNSAFEADTSQIINGLDAGTIYEYRVRAAATSSNSGNSNIISVTTTKLDQTIFFDSLSSVEYGSHNFSLVGTASSKLIVSYSSSNTSVAIVNGNIVTITGAGTTTITASQSGNTSYNAASSIEQTLAVNQANQTITFNPLPVIFINQGAFDLNEYVSSSSGLPLTFSSSNPLVATISEHTLTIIGIGTTTITSSQPGNANYFAASNVDQTLGVEKTETVTGIENGHQKFSVYPNPSSGLFTIERIDDKNENPPIQIIDATGRLVENFYFSTIEQNKYLMDITQLTNGLYLVLVDNKNALRIVKK